MQGRYSEAADMLSNAHSQFEKFGNQLGAAQCLQSLGDIHSMQGRYSEAADMLSNAHSQFEKFGNQLGAAQCLKSLGDIHRMQGRYSEAADMLSNVHSQFEKIGYQLGATQCLQSLGDIHKMQGRYSEAADMLSNAHSQFEKIGDQLGAAQCLQRLGDIHRMQVFISNMSENPRILVLIKDTHLLLRIRSDHHEISPNRVSETSSISKRSDVEMFNRRRRINEGLVIEPFRLVKKKEDVSNSERKMNEISYYQSNQGQEALKSIVKKLIPQWSNGLRDFQAESIPLILDNQDLFAITATGDGKSALFAVPILVHTEISRNPDLYPTFSVNIRKKPVGIVITPTKGLANNIVHELQEQFGISAFAYTHENISQMIRQKRNIVTEISECKFQIVCVDPEHLRQREWITITDSQTYRSNVIFGCTGEAHVIEEWGLDFRPLFRLIGSFFRGRLPSSISRFAITATMLPGAPFDSVCTALGFQGPKFHLIRRSNECPNVQIDVKTLSSSISGKEFPQLLPYLNQQRKTIIHVRTIKLGYRVFIYLFKHAPNTYNRHFRVRLYSALAPDGYNQRTIELLKNDERCQIVIATKAFSLGIHAETLVDSICIGTPDTQCEIDQCGGRVGRIRTLNARRIIFATTAELKKAKKFIEDNPDISTIKATSAPMDPAKALFLAESSCRQARINKIYTNPPSETSYLDCIDAKRRLPCDLCRVRHDLLELNSVQFPPSVGEDVLPLAVHGVVLAQNTMIDQSLCETRVVLRGNLCDWGEV
ncbi:hypothetical protein K435DRAFT_841004 [Dendrothele bispora CBS 962.96]|uniref:DNA 3'-5' helicase n=1 Tax=Dendrothele bispora (strain CBS 962.96) TaxID=1314807 RepID=A0A4S8LRG0_DENBC|nr:hypothetical protein K435DRAFT_841004 [Dendrothele bispora CBS 962.96]